MKRSRGNQQTEEDYTLPLLEKVGGGSFTMRGDDGRRIKIKPGQRFRCPLSKIPRAFRDTIRVLEEGTAPEPKKPKPPTKKLEYKVVHVGGGRYNVLNPSGQKENEKTLPKEEAQKLCDILSQG